MRPSPEPHELRPASYYSELAFLHGPHATVLLKNRMIIGASLMVERVFGWKPAELQGQSMKVLYPAQTDFEIIGRRAYRALAQDDWYSDERFMRRKNGEIVWMEGSGRAVDRDNPTEWTIWSYRPLENAPARFPSLLTPAEKMVAHYLANGFSSKEIALALRRSPRTIEVHRANMMRKMGVRNSSELVRKLLDARDSPALA